jgi:bacterioferritin
MADIEKDRVVELLNRILESELAGVIRYTHYSFLVYGYNRIPIVSWVREQATESLTHAQLAGEMITHLGAYPSLGIGRLLDSHQHDIGKILVESMEHESAALLLYKQLLAAVEGRSVMLEEYARQMIHAEELHAGEGRQDAAQARRGRRLGIGAQIALSLPGRWSRPTLPGGANVIGPPADLSAQSATYIVLR